MSAEPLREADPAAPPQVPPGADTPFAPRLIHGGRSPAGGLRRALGTTVAVLAVPTLVVIANPWLAWVAGPIAVLVLGNLALSRCWGGRPVELLVRGLAWICGLGLTAFVLLAGNEALPELIHDHRRDYGMGRLMDFLVIPILLVALVFASRFLTLALRPTGERYRTRRTR